MLQLLTNSIFRS